MQTVNKEQQERILSAINSKRWTQVDELWAELADEGPKPLAFHQPLIDTLVKKQQHPEKIVQLYSRLVDALLQKEQGESALEICEYILMRADNPEWLRIPLARAVRLAHLGSLGERIHQIIQESRIDEEATPVRKAHQKIQDLLGATKGQVYRHGTWGLGVVRELDIDRNRVVLDFQTARGKEMTLEGVRNFLTRIPKDHIHALMATDPDGLREMAKTQPAEVIRTALRSNKGRMKVADLKKVLTTRFMDENEYKSFWNNARKAIKLDPWIDQTGTGVHAELVLRSEPRTFFDEIIGQLIVAKTAADRREILRDVRRHGNDAEMTADDRKALYQLYLKPLADGTLATPSERLNHALLHVEFSDLFPDQDNPVNIDEILLNGDVLELLRSIDVPDMKRNALEHIMALYPDSWRETFAEAMIDLDPRTAAWVEKELKGKEGEHFRQVAIENILAKPDANPELFGWAARNVLEGRWKHLGDAVTPIMIIEELLSLLSEFEDKIRATSDTDEQASLKNSATKLRTLLNENNGKYVKEAAKKGSVEESRRVLNMIRLHDGLSNQLKHHLESILLNEHTELRKISKFEEEEEKKKPSYHYTTRLSLDRKRLELSQLKHDTQAMASVIEAARELGDLRENAEYHSAKDRQKLLMQQAAELEELIARARVVEEKDAAPDTSRFGTRLVLKGETGERREITLMGMWEADLPNNIISYLTPMGSQLLGHKVGAKLELVTPDGAKSTFEVMELHTALAAYSGGHS